MRAVDIKNGKGSIDDLFINDIPKPETKPTEALVRVKAFGINRMDLLQREGNYPVPPGASTILGVEFSGVVEVLGSDSGDGFEVGDEVFGLTYGGAYAEYVAVSTKMLVHKPASLSWVHAAGIPEAMYLVGRFEPGKSILWHAGASGVSIAGIQLSAAAKASSIYVTAGSDEKVAFCESELGATAGFNYRSQDWVQGIQHETGGRGVDTVIDYIGAGYFQGNLQAAALDGTIVNLAFLGGIKLPAGVDISYILRKRLRYEGSTLRSRKPEYQGKLRDIFIERALPGIEKGDFKVFVDRVFPMEQIADAHRLMESNQTKGKIVCTV
ncbi:hypothetical protein KEM56_000102 [Ascosphaera pollenicola]|nr:hypothetical protein KEM56_000102 [Ascosphaera pollenicola]